MANGVTNNQQSQDLPNALDGQAILIVDDDPHVADVLLELLQEEGFTVSYALDGQRALCAIEKSQPDLVLADMRMPRMDGLTLLHEIHNRWHDIDVIMMSATESPNELDVPFIQKPFDLDTVMSAIYTVRQFH